MQPRAILFRMLHTVERHLRVAAVVALWIPAVLGLDSFANLAQQVALGLGSWLLLLALLMRETPRTRAQVAIVVGFASIIEYTFSAGLGVYVYRLHNVPAFVPPGHGLIYLGAISLGRSRLFVEHRKCLVTATLALGGSYALWGLCWSSRPDLLGAFWFGCLAAFLVRGRMPTVYVGAFLLVTGLELIGTKLGTWTWSAHDPTGLIAIGNPPSGAAGGYSFFDAFAMVSAPGLLRYLARLRAAYAQRARRASVVVHDQQPMPAGRRRRLATASPSTWCTARSSSNAFAWPVQSRRTRSPPLRVGHLRPGQFARGATDGSPGTAHRPQTGGRPSASRAGPRWVVAGCADEEV